MNITGWHIDAFGVLSDLAIDELPSGLTVLHGPNEAGKSTLLAFIRGVLFGYPTGNSRELKYPPLNGGAHGGRIFLEGSDGRWTVERTARHSAVSITRPDGSAGTSEDLNRLLGHATKPLFRSVFAFSLTELQDFSSLDDVEVREKVFAAGITGVGTSARGAIAGLDARARDLMRPRSRSVLRDLAQEIETLDERLANGHRQLETHGQLVFDEAAQTEEIGGLRRRIDDLADHQRRLTLLQDLWPIWDRRQRAAAQLESLPDTSGFPDDGDRRLATTAETIRSAGRGLEVANDRRDRLSAERDTLDIDDRLATAAHLLEPLAAEVPLHRTGNQQSGVKRIEVDEAQRRLDDTLRELGPAWDEDRLKALNTSIPQREEVREWQARLDRTGSEQADAAREAHDARKTAAAAITELNELVDERTKIGEPLSTVALDERDRLVAELRADLTELGRLEERLTSARERADDVEREAATDPPAGTAFDPAATSRKLRWAAALALLIAVALGVVGQFVAAGIVVVIAVGSALAAGRLDAAGRRDEATTARPDAQSPQERATRARRAADDAAHEVAACRSDAEEVAHRAGFATVPTLPQLDLRATELAKERRARDQLDDCLKRIEQTRQRCNAADERMKELFSTAEERAQAAMIALDKWQQWRTAAGVDGDLSPVSCIDLFDTVRSARDLLSARDRLRHESEDLEQQLSAWEDRARDGLRRAGRHADATRLALPDEIMVTHRAAQRDAQQRHRANDLDAQIAEIDAQIRGHEADRAHAQADADAVFLEAGVSNSDAFAQRRDDHARRLEQQRLVEAAGASLRERLGSDDPSHPVLVEVATGELQQWVSERLAAERECRELERERDTAISMLSETRIRRQDLEKSTYVPLWEAERAEKLTELQRAATEWREIQVARRLIADTLTAYVRERQPQVLKTAGSHFSTVTAGRYPQLGLPPDGTIDLEVIDARRSRRKLNELSRGTAEQLYLCMRLGLAAEVAERATGLPIVMDDVLVNFSPDRAAAMVEVLAKAAENGQQILFFTCHPSIRNLILDRVPDARVEELAPHALN